MNFDPELLDKLARVFADAALRELETQSRLVRPCQAVFPGGESAAHVTPDFESLITIGDPDWSIPR